MLKEEVLAGIQNISGELSGLSDAIWDHPEVKYTEKFACRILSDYLESKGFKVFKGVAGIPTAFVAEYGCSSPVIGLLGEYDALDGLSQKADSDIEEPVTEGAPGHGCGHNLLGVGAIGAAIAVKEYIEKTGSGTVKFFGCPAEEGGSGKTFMARDGVFDGLDVAFSWHPGDMNSVSSGSNLANCQVQYIFKGKSSHAAISPELGRSALDAAELMNMGVQFLREHVPTSCRIHYAFTNAGGLSPNVVQAKASLMYLMRAPKLTQVRDLNARIDNIARGAALMTDTQLEIEFVKATSNVIPNKVLGHVMQKNFDLLGGAVFDQADYALAERMVASMDERDNYYAECAAEISNSETRERFLADADSPLYPLVFPYPETEPLGFASSDVGDVSWICPTAQIQTVTMPGGTAMHSWQEVAVGKSGIAHKGMIQAAKIMAASVIDVLDDTTIIDAAKAEHVKRTGGEPYVCPIPKGVKAPVPVSK